MVEYFNFEEAKALWDAATESANRRTENASLDKTSFGVSFVHIKCTSSIGRWALLSKLMQRDKTRVTLRYTVKNAHSNSFETAAFYADSLAEELRSRGVEAWSDSILL